MRDEIELFPIKPQNKGNGSEIHNARKPIRTSSAGSNTRRANNTRGNTGNENNVKRNTLNRNEQKKYTGNRKRQSKKRLRRKRRIKILCGIMGIVILGSFIFNWIKKNDGFPGIGGNGFEEFGAKEKKYDSSRIIGSASEQNLVAPKKYSASEIEDILEGLAETSKDYEKIYGNRDAYPEALLNALCNNSEMLDFALGYLEEEHTAKGGFTKKELEKKFPLFLQWDERWGYVPYGENCIGLSGCAPTCLSMVIVTLTNNEEATPDKLAVYAQEAGYYVENTGTAWSFMTEGAAYFGLEGKELCLSKNTIFQELEQGHPIICSMAPGDFTSQGHFIVLVKVQDGKIMVNDPNSIERSSVLWDYEVLEPQIKNLWVFS